VNFCQPITPWQPPVRSAPPAILAVSANLGLGILLRSRGPRVSQQFWDLGRKTGVCDTKSFTLATNSVLQSSWATCTAIVAALSHFRVLECMISGNSAWRTGTTPEPVTGPLVCGLPAPACSAPIASNPSSGRLAAASGNPPTGGPDTLTPQQSKNGLGDGWKEMGTHPTAMYPQPTKNHLILVYLLALTIFSYISPLDVVNADNWPGIPIRRSSGVEPSRWISGLGAVSDIAAPDSAALRVGRRPCHCHDAARRPLRSTPHRRAAPAMLMI